MREANMDKPPAMPPTDYLSLGGTEREVVGAIVTVREQATDERRVIHRSGRPREAVRDICLELDALPGEWRVLSISTPATIFRDLQGTRDCEWTDETNLPERRLLLAIGRNDMLDPSLEPRVGGIAVALKRRRGDEAA